MKKRIALILALALCLTLAACGGPDKQPAIDAFNAASDVFDEVVDAINADIEAYPEDLVETMIDMSGLLTEYKTMLESDQEFTEEQLAEMIEWFGTVEDLMEEIKAEYGI